MFSREKFKEKWEAGSKRLKANCIRDERGVIFHETRIVEFLKGGKVKLHTGGWKTPGTKDHMNIILRCLGKQVYVFQHKHVWYVDINGSQVEFKDGMVVK